MDQNKTLEDSIDEVAEECINLLIKKQKDYGHSNITKFGEKGVLVRASDKIERLKNLLMSDKEPENENIVDSWMDLVNYGLIALMLRKGTFRRPLEDSDEKSKTTWTE